MADVEFEEFRKYFEELPQHNNSLARNYTLVHDVAIEQENLINLTSYKDSCTDEDDEEYPIVAQEVNESNSSKRPNEADFKVNIPFDCHHRSRNLKEKKRKKFLYKPKIQKGCDQNFLNDYVDVGSVTVVRCNVDETDSDGIADDDEREDKNENCKNDDNVIEYVGREECFGSSYTLTNVPALLCLKRGFPSPDSEPFDSGNSTAYSPEGSLITSSAIDFIVDGGDAGYTNERLLRLELLEGTHRALHKFIARHSDELELEIGDSIYVEKEAEDLWYEGINLRNGRKGIFPSAYVVDVDYNEFDPAASRLKCERFLLTYLGSVETRYHKGYSVLREAVRKVTSTKRPHQSCVLEISEHGLRMCDRPRRQERFERGLRLDYFYSLKNVSFCGFCSQNPRFMGFITKHPTCDKFACHVFQTSESAEPVTESIGKAFQRFYEKCIDIAYPIEDIYIE